MPTVHQSTRTTRAPVIPKRKKITEKEGSEVVSPRRLLGVKKRIFARLAGFSERAITDYEAGKKVSEALRAE